MSLLLKAAQKKRKQTELLLLGGSIWYLYFCNDARTTRSIWTREWLLRRQEFGAYNTLLSELRQEDQASFLNFLRMSPAIYDQLLEQVRPHIQKMDTAFRNCISPGMRLAITLRFLATGETYISLSYLFRVANNTIGLLIPETCAAIHTVLKDEYLKCPTTVEEWRSVARDYWQQWNFPNCIGSLDGKHVMIRKPACSGAMYFNYKHSFSVVLLALVDASYRFLFVDIGCQGRCSDAGIFADSDLNETLQNNALQIPAPEALPGTQEKFPYVIVADDAFPLREGIMKPYPHRNLEHNQRIFNYWLSRARRCVENAFGIMCNRFRCLLNPLCLAPEKVNGIVLACCSLHNLLRTIVPSNYVCTDEDRSYTQQATTNMRPARVAGFRSATKVGKETRDKLCKYFNSKDGAVSWQDNMI